MICQKCGRQGLRRKDLRTPDDPDSRLKCSKCGEWDALKSWNYSDTLPQRRADALEVLQEIFRHVPDVLEVGNSEVVVEMCVPDELWQRAQKIAKGE